MRRLTKFILSCVVFFIQILYRLSINVASRGIPERYIILTYHNIQNNQVEKFRRQMLFLLRYGIPVHANMDGPFQSGKIHIAVTFDDGFEGAFQNALPILRELRIPATFFITTGYLGEKPGWILDPSNENMSTRLLTEGDIVSMKDSGFSIGSHSISHPELSSISKIERTKELKESKSTLEKILTNQVDLLAFPYGDVNSDVLDAAYKTGYRKVYLNVPRLFFRPGMDSIIGRIDISPEDWDLEFKLKILGAYQWLPLAIALKRYFLNGGGREGLFHGFQ